MKFSEIPKNIPKRKYLVINAFESTWNLNHILGIIDMKIDGTLSIVDIGGYVKHYQPFEIIPIKDIELNSIDINHILYVYIQPSDNYDIKIYKETPEFKALIREATIDKIID